MLFNSIEFLIFFVLVVGTYFTLPSRFRWILLLLASYFFYAFWKYQYLFLIIASTLVDYFAGLMMAKCKTKSQRKPYLILSLLVNLGLLFFFKYFNFFSGSLQELIHLTDSNYEFPVLELLLPVGISFYTFQTLSYSIDVYNDKTKVEKHLGIFALYVSFFPQLVAGPIERSNRLLPQFRKSYSFDYERVRSGLLLMLWGFFKKIFVADRLAFYVNEVFNHPSDYEGTPIILASIFFAFQIYCDFSGYSDIAIGTARVMGFDLMKNFETPYFSKSIGEFWRRWHISLSTWFRDYVYIPLGGNRVVKWRWYYNLFLTFLISGLWHGANWTFVFWGALHGFYLIFALLIQPNKILPQNNNFSKFIHLSVTFVLVVFAWIFFRANNIQDAFLLIQNSVNDLSLSITKINILNKPFDLMLCFSSICILLIIDFIQRKGNIEAIIVRQKLVFRWAIYLFLIYSILLFGVFEKQEFIYFQF